MKFKTGVAMAIVGFLGFLDASYLTMEHFLNKVPPCNLLHGCEVVTTSQYAVVFGISVALLGAIYYFVVFVGSIFALQSKNIKIFRLVSYLTWVGFLASVYFVYLQLFVIHSICQYCMLSALTSTTLFILGMYNLYSRSQALN